MKKGFTLVELLAVIVVLAIIALIIFPVVNKQINRSKDDLYEVQVDNIKKAAKDMVTDNLSLLDEAHVIPTLISIEDMQSTTNPSGVAYLESGDIINPVDNSKMNGTVIITYDFKTSSYVYEYQEKSKAELAPEITTPASKTVISNQRTIYTNEEKSGLFEDVSNNEYVFRGAEPNNFLKIGADYWRILSINKDTYEMKIAKTTRLSTGVWSNDSSESNYLLSNTNLKMYTYLNSDFYETLKIKDQMKENTKWNIGNVALTNKTLKSVMQEEAKSTLNANVGLLTISDVIRASSSLVCRSDVTKDECMTTNYLILESAFFLANIKNGNVYIIDGEIKTQDPTRIASIIPVVTLTAAAKVETGHEGTSEDPYILVLNS